MLTDEQIAHFRVFGFVVLRQVFGEAEIGNIGRAFDDVLTADRGGAPFDGAKRQAVFGTNERHPVLTDLLADERINGPLDQLLGSGFAWIGSDGNLYVGDTGWHPDGTIHTFERLKVALYLDPVTRDTGCLRVVPGSHRSPLHEALLPLHPERRSDPSVSAFGATQPEIPAYRLESQPGDVVIFHSNLWHAAFGGRVGRRMLAMSFISRPTTEEHVNYLLRTYENNLRNIQRLQGTQVDWMYGESFLRSDQRRIKSMVSKLIELGFR